MKRGGLAGPPFLFGDVDAHNASDPSAFTRVARMGICAIVDRKFYMIETTPAFETRSIYAVFVWFRPQLMKDVDTADGTEAVLRYAGVESVEAERRLASYNA